MSGEAHSLEALQDVYAATAEIEVKRAILEAFVIADDEKRLFAAAQAEKDERLRRQAIEQLGAVGGIAELQQLYRAETSAQVREAILDAFVAADAEAALTDAARNEKDSRLRVKAIHNLGATGGREAGVALQQLYASEKDGAVRRAILDGFVAADECQPLIQIGRGEKDPALRRAVVERLSAMDCPEAADFLLEILKK
jgi:HEAT repeat protein